LQFRLADEFELLEAPDISVLSNKTKETAIGQSLKTCHDEIPRGEGFEFEEESKQGQKEAATGAISDTFSI